MTSAIPMQCSANSVKIRSGRWRSYIHFFIAVHMISYIHSPNYYCYPHYYYCYLFSSTLRFNFITLCSQLNVNGVINWSLLIWRLYLTSFAGFPFPYFPIFQIVDMPVLRVSSEALEMYSSARRRWRQHNLRGVFRRWRKYCKRLCIVRGWLTTSLCSGHLYTGIWTYSRLHFLKLDSSRTRLIIIVTLY